MSNVTKLPASADCWPEVEGTLLASLAAHGAFPDLVRPLVEDLRQQILSSMPARSSTISPEYRDAILGAIGRAGGRTRKVAVEMFASMLAIELAASESDLSPAGRAAAVARLAGRRFAVVDGGKGP